MSIRTTAAAGALASVLALVGCGGETKQADSPGTCPDGTVLRGSDCVPPGDSAGDDSSSSHASKDPDESSSSSSSSPSSGDGASSGASSGGKTPYDKDAVESELKRAARQVKSNCGSATDSDGKATGPWGETKVSIVLGRNGHVKQATVPSPYDGKPVGVCVTHAFEKIQFPPYAASSDVVLDWDITINEPKKH